MSGGRLGRDALVYALGFIAQRAAGFLMLPIYTRYLDPAAYATLHLVQMTLDVTSILLASGVTAGVYRYYFKTEAPTRRRAVILSAWALMTLFNGLGALLLVAFAPQIAVTVLKDPQATELVYWGAANFALDPSLVVPALLLQVQRRAVAYTGVSLARLTLQLGFNVLFLVGYGEGVRGILWSTCIAYVALNPGLLWGFFRFTGRPPLRAALKDLVLFGLPYRLTEGGAFILTYADRFFLLGAHGLFVTGVYSLAYQFGFVLGYLGAVPFFMAWNPLRFKLADHPPEARAEAFGGGFLLLSVVMVTLGTGISLFVEPTLGLMSNADYHGAAPLVPVILLAYVFQAWTQAVEFGIQVAERTRYATYGTWIAVVIILALYALLIPPLGPWGAALATAVAFLARLVAYAVFAHRLYPVDYPWGPALRTLASGALAVAGYFAWAPQGFWLQLGAATALTVAYGLGVWGLALDRARRVALRRMAARGVAAAQVRLGLGAP